MANTVTFFTDKQVNPAKLSNDIITASAQIDFSLRNCIATDIVQVLKIPKGAYVFRHTVTVDTPEGGTCTATVGDGAAAAGYDASTNLNATANTTTTSLAGTDAYAEGKLYTADDTIDLVLGHDTDTAKVTVCAAFFMVPSVMNA